MECRSEQSNNVVTPFKANRPQGIDRYESFESFIQTLAPTQLRCSSPSPNLKMEEAGALSNATQECQGREPGEDGREPGAEARGGNAVGGKGEDNLTEIKSLQELVQLLQVRLDALQKALEMQEHEVCREVGRGECDRSVAAYERLLSRWRREVCLMLLKQRVDALQVEQKQLQHTQKEQHLIVQLHEARALVEVLKQKERNSQAEIAILTTSTKLAKMTMKEEGERKKHEMEDTLKGVTKATSFTMCHILESHSMAMTLYLGRMSNAACRLDMYGKRIFFAEQQVTMAAGLISSSLAYKAQGSFSNRPNGSNDHFIYTSEPRKNSKHQQETMLDHAARTQQLEALLAATKNQLADECLHARELQERMVKCESEARESIKRAGKKAQDQADRDLAAIKRQHKQATQTLQQKLVRVQAEQAKMLATNHQLEHKASHQQREFAHLINQKDIEFKRALDAKENEVNRLIGEQNALLVKLKKFWQPVLNSSSAKVLSHEKSTPQNVSQGHRGEGEGSFAVDDQKPSHVHKGKGGGAGGEETRTLADDQERKKPTSSTIDGDKSDIEHDETQGCPKTKSCYTQTPPLPIDHVVAKKKRSKLSGIHKLSTKVQRQLYPFLGSDVPTTNYHEEDDVFETSHKFKDAIPLCYDLFSPTSKRGTNCSSATSPQTRRQKKKDEELITSFLLKLQKSYINSRSSPSRSQDQDLSMAHLMTSGALNNGFMQESHHHHFQDYNHGKEEVENISFDTISPFPGACHFLRKQKVNGDYPKLYESDKDDENDNNSGSRHGNPAMENHEWLRPTSSSSIKEGRGSSQPSKTKRVNFRDVPVEGGSPSLEEYNNDDVLPTTPDPQYVICIPRRESSPFVRDERCKSLLQNLGEGPNPQTRSPHPDSLTLSPSTLKAKLDSIEALSENLL